MDRQMNLFLGVCVFRLQQSKKLQNTDPETNENNECEP